jgi:hypothetical protein
MVKGEIQTPISSKVRASGNTRALKTEKENIMLGWIKSAFGAGEAIKFAGDLLKDGAKQQVTGWLGFSLDDEAIMISIMNVLEGDIRDAVEAFLIHIGDRRNRFRQVLGKMQLPTPGSVKENVLVLGPDGQPLLEKGNRVFKEKVTTDPSVAYTDRDPRVLLLKRLGECILQKGIRDNGFTDGFKDGEVMLLVTGALLEKSHWQIAKQVFSGLKQGGQEGTAAAKAAIFKAFAVQDYAGLVKKAGTKASQLERELEHKRRLGFLGWLLNKRPYTLIYFILAICAIIWLIEILATTTPF